MHVQSITAWLFHKLKGIAGGYKNTAVYALYCGLISGIKASFNESCLRYSIFSGNGLYGRYPSSCFYRFLSFLMTKTAMLADCICKGVQRLAKDSLLSSMCGRFCRKVRFEYVYALFFAGMLCIPHSMWNNGYAVLAAAGFAAVYLVKHVTGKDRVSLNSYALPLSLLLFLISVLSATLLAPSFSAGCRSALFFLSGILFMLQAWGSIRDEKTLRTVVGILVTGLFGMCFIGVCQALAGVDVDVMLTDVGTNSGMPGRVYATMGNPNNFAEIIILLVPFVYAMILCSDKKTHKALFAGMLAVCIAALAVSYSRAGYIALILATVVFAALYDYRLLLPIALVGVLSIPFLPESIMNRIFTIGSLQDTSNAYRLFLWQGTTEMMKDYFLSGVGIGTEAFSSAYAEYAHIHALNAPHSHMLYMELVIELGIFGAAAFLVFMGGVLRRSLAVSGKTGKTLRCMRIAAISAFCGISFSACVEYIWFYPRVLFVFWMVAGLAMCAVRLSKSAGRNGE